MAEVTGIQWTDATVNFWWGCTKVGPGCDHCYAEAWSLRFGENIWGPGAPRRLIKSATALLTKLHRQSDAFYNEHGRRRRVFAQSMSDMFDNEVERNWLLTSMDWITSAHSLDFQIVTKRVTNVEKRLGDMPWPRNAGLIISVVNQAEADRDIPRLLELKAKLGIPWVGLSIEPMLGAIALRPEWLVLLDWVIVGGESGSNARPLHPAWVRSLLDQCAGAGVPFFFKQWGEWIAHPAPGAKWKDGSGPVPPELEPVWYDRVGKARAGRLLDGLEYNGFPKVRHG